MKQVTLMIILLVVGMSFLTKSPQWGFYGHRTINKMAVFSLPPEMVGFYKKHINYISDHAVDPDKRRYATKHEGVRHYIDIDVWGEYPFDQVPRRFDDALMKYAYYHLIKDLDTTLLNVQYEKDSIGIQAGNEMEYIPIQDFRDFWNRAIIPQYYEDEWIVDRLDTLSINGFTGGDRLVIKDHFSEYGIVPYYLLTMKHKLTNAFKDQDEARILRLSAEIGHYIGDAHVPLHTTENYNGQMTNQVGIHAFWESRLPELFAEDKYDFLVGRAEYVDHPSSYFWDVVLKSHSYLDEVLSIEKRLSLEFPDDEQYCYDERLDRTVRIQCPEYAAAYSRAMNGMVEERFTAAILSIASIWYTCWIDAGLPDLDNLEEVEIQEEEYIIDPKVKAGARQHDN